jgi:hypothetical protein
VNAETSSTMPPISHMRPMSVITTASDPSRLRSAMTPATTKNSPTTASRARSEPSRAVAVMDSTIRTTPCSSSQMPKSAAITFSVASGQASITTPSRTLVRAPTIASHQAARRLDLSAAACSASSAPAGSAVGAAVGGRGSGG